MNDTLDTLRALEVPPDTTAVLCAAAVALVCTDLVLGRREHRAFVAAITADPAHAERFRVALSGGGRVGRRCGPPPRSR